MVAAVVTPQGRRVLVDTDAFTSRRCQGCGQERIQCECRSEMCWEPHQRDEERNG